MRQETRCINTQLYDSHCGKIILASLGDKLCLCDWTEMPCTKRNQLRLKKMLNADFNMATSEVMEQAKLQLNEYFAGCRQSFDIPLLLVGTDFQQQVWHELLRIPYGETRNYKAIAENIGKPHAVRAVANAIGANGISIIVPCHRVVGSNHSLTGYAGGLEAKKILLKTEVKYGRNETLVTTPQK